MTELPLFYFKPSIYCLDDDSIFLESLKYNFTKYNFIACNNPLDALEFFKNYHSSLDELSLKRRMTESELFGVFNHYPIDINIADIKKLYEHSEKINEIAILIVDYSMPDLNGLQICEKFKDMKFKKILLTGHSSHEDAVEAFNNGLIDKFIKKDLNVVEKLNLYIDELVTQFFSEMTSNLLCNIETEKKSLLSDVEFIRFFKKWCAQNNIEEYYLIDPQGSFIVKDNNNKTFYFVAMSENDRCDFLKIYDETFELKPALKKEFVEGNVIPFFGTEKELWNIELTELDSYFYPCEIFSGKSNYYWAIVK